MRQLYYTFRTLLRGRGVNLTKIVSLTLGLLVGILLFARVAFELSFDGHYKEVDRLCVINAVYYVGGEKGEAHQVVLAPVPGAIAEGVPDEIESSTVVRIRYGDNTLFYNNVRQCPKMILSDSLFFKTMGIDIISGDPRELVNPETMFVSRSFARRIFGDESPIGKTLLYNRTLPMTIKGVYEDIPENSSLYHEVVISFSTIEKHHWECMGWECGDSFQGYIRLKNASDLDKVNSRIDPIIEKHLPFRPEEGFAIRYSLQPIRGVHASAPVIQKMVMIMSLLGLVILFIAAMNYVLISISSLARRAKAIGVHKCNGASERNIFSMFLWETGIIIMISLILVSVLVLNFREDIEYLASASIGALFTWETLWVPICVIVILFIVAGIIPGHLFSSIPVTHVFRNYTERKGGWKRTLLFLQFTGVTFVLGILCVVLLQYNRITTKPIGYNPEGVAFTYHNFADSESALDNLRRLPMVSDVSDSESSIISGYGGLAVTDENGIILFTTRLNACLYNYVPFMGIRIKEGRNLNGPDQALVNEEFVRQMRWTDGAVGKKYENFTIVGVMENFPVNSYYEEQDPVAFIGQQQINNCYHVRLKQPYEENLRSLNKSMEEMYPTEDIVFKSLSYSIEDQYQNVRRFRDAVMLAFVVILLISLMGLIGYISDEIQRRSKEIAIRKVNGAEVSHILNLLSKDIIWTASPAVLFGTAGAYFVGIQWLGQFAERISLQVYWFVLIAIVVLAMIFLSAVIKVWHIANENPVKSIKSE